MTEVTELAHIIMEKENSGIWEKTQEEDISLRQLACSFDVFL